MDSRLFWRVARLLEFILLTDSGCKENSWRDKVKQCCTGITLYFDKSMLENFINSSKKILPIVYSLLLLVCFLLGTEGVAMRSTALLHWEEQDGWIWQGRCPHVSQSAGRKLRWHITNIAHNIHSICHLGPCSSWSNTSFPYFWLYYSHWLHLTLNLLSSSDH